MKKAFFVAAMLLAEGIVHSTYSLNAHAQACSCDYHAGDYYGTVLTACGSAPAYVVANEFYVDYCPINNLGCEMDITQTCRTNCGDLHFYVIIDSTVKSPGGTCNYILEFTDPCNEQQETTTSGNTVTVYPPSGQIVYCDVSGS